MHKINLLAFLYFSIYGTLQSHLLHDFNGVPFRKRLHNFVLYYCMVRLLPLDQSGSLMALIDDK